jgi:type I restriction enzyme S subunit
MGKLEKYTSYRDSGIHTSIQVPEHWNIKRFKHLFSFGKGLNITKENLEDTGIECVNYGEIHSKFGFEVNPDIHELKCVNESYLKKDSKSLLNIGDFIFADTSEDIEGSGNFTHLTGNKTIFAGYHTMICRPKKTLNSKYYAYLFDSKSFRSQLHKKVKGVKVYSITQNILKDTCVWIPEDNEQTKIASFLDEKTAQIDKAISQKEKLIELLKERRQITINDAVTKGLDKAVEFKNSGVEWIGEIPKHWNLLANKHIFKLKKDTVGKNSSEYSLLSLTLQGIIKRDLDGGGKFPAEFDTYQEVKQGDFVFCLFDVEETPRTVGLSEYDGMITGAYTVMSVQDMDRKYLYYFYLNLDSKKRLKPLYRGLRNTIPKDSFFAFKTFVPPKNEQIKIVEYIETQTTKIDKAIELQQNYIAKLKEYKASLIDSVVTGKVRVV